MPETLIKVDLTKSAYDNDMIHNRWHPDIPIVAWVKPGDDFIIETVDWTGGFIKNNDSADDVRDIDLTTVHFLSGPIEIEDVRGHGSHACASARGRDQAQARTATMLARITTAAPYTAGDAIARGT